MTTKPKLYRLALGTEGTDDLETVALIPARNDEQAMDLGWKLIAAVFGKGKGRHPEAGAQVVAKVYRWETCDVREAFLTCEPIEDDRAEDLPWMAQELYDALNQKVRR